MPIMHEGGYEHTKVGDMPILHGASIMLGQKHANNAWDIPYSFHLRHANIA